MDNEEVNDEYSYWEDFEDDVRGTRRSKKKEKSRKMKVDGAGLRDTARQIQQRGKESNDDAREA